MLLVSLERIKAKMQHYFEATGTIMQDSTLCLKKPDRYV